MRRLLGGLVIAVMTAVGLAALPADPVAAAAPAVFPLPGEPPVRPSRPAPVEHHAYVAILEGDGDYGTLTEDDLGDVVRKATTFWTTEAGSAVTGFPVTVTTFTWDEPHLLCGAGNAPATIAAAQEAAFPDVDFSDAPHHLVVLVPDECSQAGGASVWASRGVDLGDGGQLVVDAEMADPAAWVARMLGVNLGLVGAYSVGGSFVERDCQDGQSIGCSGDAPLEDPYSPIGFTSGLIALGTAERAWLGLVGASESPVVTLPPDASSVTEHFRIRPRGQGRGRRSVTVVDPETGRHYYVDYRAGVGRDAGAAYLDATPHSYTTFGAGVTVTSMDLSPAPHLWPVETGWGDVAHQHHTYRGAALPGDTVTSTDGAVQVSVDDIEPGEWADVTVRLATDAEPLVAPHRPKLVFSTLGGPRPGPAPDCQEIGEVDWGDGWPAGTEFSIFWYAGERRVFPYASWRTELDTPCYRHRRLQVEMTARAPGYRPVTVYSGLTRPMTRYYGGNAIIQHLNGDLDLDAEAGRPLVAGAFFYPDISSGGNTLPAESLQWLIDGDPIEGATHLRYTPDDSDVGKVLTLRAVRDDPDYDRTVFVSQKVLIGASQFVRARPTLSGRPRVGDVLHAAADGWSPGTTFSYTWERDGEVVPGAHAAAYRLDPDDLGAEVRVVVEGTWEGYTPATRRSEAVTVARGVLATQQPRVRGRARVGRRLHAAPGAWTDGTMFTFQWLVGGRPVAGATAATYLVPRRLVGRLLQVRVTGAHPGYAPETVVSGAVRVSS